jgi:hypothetical protein
MPASVWSQVARPSGLRIQSDQARIVGAHNDPLWAVPGGRAHCSRLRRGVIRYSPARQVLHLLGRADVRVVAPHLATRLRVEREHDVWGGAEIDQIAHLQRRYLVRELIRTAGTLEIAGLKFPGFFQLADERSRRKRPDPGAAQSSSPTAQQHVTLRVASHDRWGHTESRWTAHLFRGRPEMTTRGADNR